jgi:hypothetical protein
MRIGEKARNYLILKNIDAIMFGDGNLLHEIADVCGIRHRGFQTEIQILNAIDRCPDLFEKLYVGRMRYFRIKAAQDVRP